MIGRTCLDPTTGERTHPISITVNRDDEMLPTILRCTSWAAVVDYLDSPAFAAIADSVDTMTISR